MQFSFQMVLNDRHPSAFMAGCNYTKACGFAHCNRCADRLHPGAIVSRDFIDEPRSLIWLPKEAIEDYD